MPPDRRPASTPPLDAPGRAAAERALAAAFAGSPPPRPLTDAERRDVACELRRDDAALSALGALATLFGAGMMALTLRWSVRRDDWGMALFAAAAAAVFGYLTWFFGAHAVRPHPLGRPEDFRRAQRLRGRLAFVGLPPSPTIGGVPVVSAFARHLPDGALVEAEVSPALGDDPRPERPRLALGAPALAAEPTRVQSGTSGAPPDDDLALAV